MSKFVVTAKVQVHPERQVRKSLDRSMVQYSLACDRISEVIFKTHNLNQAQLQEQLYDELRDKFGLKSQMACSSIRTVIAKYKTILSEEHQWIQPKFRKPQLDLVWNRDYSLVQGVFSVNTLDGRIKAPFDIKGMEHYFDKDKFKFGTARLVCSKRKYFLHIPVTTEVDDCEITEICNVVGIDRGINFIAVSYDSKGKSSFFDGGKVKHKRAQYKELRAELQKRGTASARRRLKKIGQRENRWMNDVNHCVSKALVTDNPSKTLFVLENLKGIRGATEKVRRKDRYVQVSWSYYDLEQKLKYKAQRNSCLVINVDPRYTSQCCPKCGHIEKSNRDKKLHCFCCKNCGYRSNDDRIGAMNLFNLGLNWIKEQTECSESISLQTGVQSITPRCNDSQSTEKKVGKKRSRTSKVRSRATGQLQAHRL